MGHVLMENRNGLAVGTAEREAALTLLDRRQSRRRVTLGADKAYDVIAFVDELRACQVTPHIAIDGRVSKLGVVRKTAVRGRTTRHAGYRASQICRKPIEEVFGCIKTQAGLAKVKLRGCAKGGSALHLHCSGLQPHPHSQADSGRRMTLIPPTT